MKKTLYLTILAIVTVICIIIGSVYHISGWFSGSWFGGHGIIGNILNVVTNNSGNPKLDHSRVTYSENLDAFDKIEIDTDVMDITINTGDSYHLEYDCVAYLEPEVSVKDKTFHLEQLSKWWGSNNKCSMNLTVPSGTVLNDTYISSDVGNVKIYNIESEHATLEVNVGDITLESCKFVSSDITGDVGNINVNTSNLGDSTIENDTGNIEVDLCEFEDIDIYNDIGNVDLNTNTDLSNYEIDLSTDLGSIKYNGEKQKKYYHQSAVSTSNTYNIEIETDVGNIIFN